MMELIQADARKLPLADESVQCIVTSPPYWGLRKYAGEQELKWKGWRGAYGLEPTIEMYLEHTVTILRELRRVLRRDGVLFWNIGDSYSANGGHADTACNGRRGAYNLGNRPEHKHREFRVRFPKPKDLCLIPARVALAAQSDGWWVRSLIIWAKPNPMPESVTDRPTDAYEHIIMLTKSERYFWDADAVREPTSETSCGNRREFRGGGTYTQGREFDATEPVPNSTPGNRPHGYKPGHDERDGKERFCSGTGGYVPPGGRNMRNVWMFATQPYPEAHFATFPEELPRRCILAATSAKGACAQCGAPWERIVRASGGSIGEAWHDHENDEMRGQRANGATTDGTYRRDQIGWAPTCRCRGQHGRTQPCVVLDPFGGSGTTGRVAIELRRRAILCDVAYGEQDTYRKLAQDRTSEVQTTIGF